MLAYYMNSAELQRWLSTLRHPGNNGNYEMFTQHYTIGEDYMKDIPCIRLACGKFELTNQDSAGGKKFTVLTSM